MGVSTYRAGQKVFHTPPSPLGPRVSQQSGAARNWWDPNDVLIGAGVTIYAYRAIASAGSPWGDAPANYAETLRNWANPGTNDLTEGNGAVPWAANTGWQFNAGASQWLDTVGILPVLNTTSVFMQFTNVTSATDVLLCGVSTGGGIPANGIGLIPNRFGTRRYLNWGSLIPGAAILAGNMGMAGLTCYADGVSDGVHPDAGGAPVAGQQFYIGAWNWLGAGALFISANISAAWFADSNPALVQAQAPSLVSAMAAL